MLKLVKFDFSKLPNIRRWEKDIADKYENWVLILNDMDAFVKELKID